MKLHAPQIVLILWYFSKLLFVAAKQGKQPPPLNLTDSIVATIIVFLILFWGGFFG